METYTPTATYYQQDNQATAQPEQQQQVGGEWGQHFVDNFFQAGAQQSAYSQNMEYSNTPTQQQQQSYFLPPQTAFYNPMPSPVCYTSSSGQQYLYPQQPCNSGYAYTYYDATKNQYTALPQFQAPQYGNLATPQSQVYTIPPVVKRSSPKKKKGTCC